MRKVRFDPFWGRGPGLSEPRARKRRPKNYQLLTQPRRKMRVSISRYMK